MRRTKKQIEWELSNEVNANKYLNSEMNVMRNSVVEAMVRLPNVQEYVGTLEKEYAEQREKLKVLREAVADLTKVLKAVTVFLTVNE